MTENPLLQEYRADWRLDCGIAGALFRRDIARPKESAWQAATEADQDPPMGRTAIYITSPPDSISLKGGL
jgi:hypothetical protein